MKYLGLLLILFAQLSFADEATRREAEQDEAATQAVDRRILGSWTRVYNSCEDITPEMARSLQLRARTENVWKQMSFYLDLESYEIVSFESYKCRTHGICPPQGKNIGIVRFEPGNRFTLDSTSNTSKIGWGTVYRDWSYELIEGALVLKSRSSLNCPDGDGFGRVVLIRTPAS